MLWAAIIVALCAFMAALNGADADAFFIIAALLLVGDRIVSAIERNAKRG